MSRNRLPITAIIGATAAILAIGVVRYAQWERNDLLVLPDGRSVPDVPKSETGPFGAPDRVHLRRRYLGNLEIYRTLPMAEVQLSDSTLVGAEQFIPAIRAHLAADSASTAALAALPHDARSDLEEALTLVFSRIAGLPIDAYRRRLLEERRWEGPPALPEFWDSVPGRSMSDDPKAAFVAEYEKLNLREGRLTAVASSEAGWRIVVRSVSSNRGGNEFILFETCSPQDVELFGGGLGVKALNFHPWPADWAAFSKANPRVHLAEASTIIQTANGDRYPLHTVFIYDTVKKRWRLTKAFRQVTVRLARIGSLAF